MSDDGGLPIEGVDYAFTPHPSPAALVAAGKKFAVRYGGPGSGTKLITPGEAASLAAAGLWLVANAEQAQKSALNGFAAGVSHAQSARAAFGACGMPADRPIYYSIDFDVQQADWPAVTAYFHGIHSVHGVERTGIYGSRWAMLWAQRDGLAKYFWQCTAATAWSGGTGGQLAPFAHLAQYRNGVPVGGADCDLDRAMKADYGQWMPGVTPTPPKRKKAINMWFGDVPPDPKLYVMTGTQTRYMPPGTWESTAAQLVDAGVPFLHYATLQDLLDAGGPLSDTSVPVSATLDAESLASALRPIIRDELNKSHLTD